MGAEPTGSATRGRAAPFGLVARRVGRFFADVMVTLAEDGIGGAESAEAIGRLWRTRANMGGPAGLELDAEIAEQMFLSPNTVKVHLRHVYRSSTSPAGGPPCGGRTSCTGSMPTT